MNGVAQIIAAVALFVMAAAAFLLVWRRGFQSAHVGFGPITVELEAIKAEVQAARSETAAINRAVNNVPPGTPPLPARIGAIEHTVRYLEDMVRWAALALRIIGAHTGATMPDPPNKQGVPR